MRRLAPFANPIDEALVRSNLSTALGFMGRFDDARSIEEETTAVLEAMDRPVAPSEYYYLSPLVSPYNMGVLTSFMQGRVQSWRSRVRELESRLADLDPLGVVLGLTMLIYVRYLAADWGAVSSDARETRQKTVSQIEGAAYYLDLIRLAELRLEGLEGSADVEASVEEVMGRASVAFAMQHQPRYQMIAGDILAHAGNPGRARPYYLEAPEGRPLRVATLAKIRSPAPFGRFGDHGRSGAGRGLLSTGAVRGAGSAGAAARGPRGARPGQAPGGRAG